MTTHRKAVYRWWNSTKQEWEDDPVVIEGETSENYYVTGECFGRWVEKNPKHESHPRLVFLED